ncbi:hypothetical protein SteCoe_17860 [Stentor coeruleus]|uniref:USP domain-containing protein n=1 Tax=Stentor coeruleus TaxID=5963 RepID=A0A1R2BXV7_9CILI|nr:hypothetical protein SteCoe_17860 [Stentor coeruleus]
MVKKSQSKTKEKSMPNGKYVQKTLTCSTCQKFLKNTQQHNCICKRGIVNIGNSCYISSVLHAVAELNIYSTLPEDSQLGAFLKVLSTHSTKAASPRIALCEINDLWEHRNLQEDAFEFFMTILPLLQSSKFTYEYLSQRLCEICHYTCEAVIREDCSIHMEVNGTSLQEQLQSSVEPIDEICKNCSKGYMMRYKNISKAPEILAVRIVRFMVNEKTGKPSKIWNKVALPAEVTVNGKLYKLEVVILHKSKALHHGHYTVYLRNKKILIDDEKVYYNKTLKLDYSYYYLAFYV